MVPTAIATALEEHMFTNPEYFDLDERELWRKLRDDSKTPTPTDNRLRLKFWVEYDRAMAHGGRFTIGNVLASLCTGEYFYKKYLSHPGKVAWLVTPPAGYLVKAEEALEFGLEQLRDLLDQPHVSFGKVDTKLGELKAKIVMMLDARVKGAVVQRSMNMNINTSTNTVNKELTGASMEELEKRLKELDARERRARNVPTTVEGEVSGKPDIEIDPT